MSVDSIPQVAKAGLIDSSSVSDASRRSVSKSEVDSFTLALNSTSNTTQASSTSTVTNTFKPLLDNANKSISAAIKSLDFSVSALSKDELTTKKSNALSIIGDTLNNIKNIQSTMTLEGSSSSALSHIKDVRTALEEAQNSLTIQIDSTLTDAKIAEFNEKFINDAKGFLHVATQSTDSTNKTITMDQVNEVTIKGILNNMVQLSAQHREELKKAIEGEG